MAINTNIDLVGDIRPVVTPSATAAMSEAVRNGTISVLDIMDRVSARTKAKEDLELVTANQGILDATNPDLIQAKRNQQLAVGAAAGSALKLNPLAEQAKTAELKAAIFDAQAKPGGFDLMQTALSKAGFPVSVDPNVGLTDANKNEIIKRFSALNTYTLKLADAEESVKNIDTKFFPTEKKLPDGSATRGQLQKLFRNGLEITSDDLKSLVQKSAALKRTPFSQWYSLQDTQPGQAVTPAAPTQPLIQALPQPVSTAPVIQPVTQAATAPTAPQIGQPDPNIGIVTGIEAPSAAVRPTEGQQRALLAVPRFQEANTALADLQARGYDPTSWVSWIDSYLPQIVKSGDRKEFETAMSVWSQGLLRLESGAAITPKEQVWYERAFFPVVGDPPLVLRQKEALRHSVEGMVAELGAAGPIGEDLKKRAHGVFQAAGTFATGGSTAVTPSAAPVAPAATPSAAPVYTLTEVISKPSGTVFKDANGNLRRKL